MVLFSTLCITFAKKRIIAINYFHKVYASPSVLWKVLLYFTFTSLENEANMIPPFYWGVQHLFLYVFFEKNWMLCFGHHLYDGMNRSHWIRQSKCYISGILQPWLLELFLGQWLFSSCSMSGVLSKAIILIQGPLS